MSKTFNEISSALSKNIDDVANKKKALDEANTAVNKAGQEYQIAIESGIVLKQNLMNILNESYPAELKNKIG
jgi:non-canonical (house-cleaning) NTP pyrophosphatase